MNKNMNIKPLGNRVLVKRSSSPTSKGGILLPETVKEKPRQGEVIAIGPGKTNKKGEVVTMPLKIGDIVIYSNYGGVEVPNEGEDDYLLLSEDDILAVLV